MQNNFPIGVFDSGLGGLIILKELQKILPNESFIYFGDTAHIPYGNKSQKSIQKYSKKIVQFLNSQKVKLIVVACNSASSVAIDIIKDCAKSPLIDVISPAVKKACETTKNNQIGIIGTDATISSGAYQNNIFKFNKKIKILTQSCPLLVPIIEEGLYKHEIGLQAINLYLNSLKQSEIDTLILGCTHYPIMAKSIQNYLAPKISGLLNYKENTIHIINSSAETATTVQEFLKNNKMENLNHNKKEDEYYVSDKTIRFHTIANIFLNKKINNINEIEL